MCPFFNLCLLYIKKIQSTSTLCYNKHMKKRIVLALGGNALQKNGEASAEAQKKIAIAVGSKIAELANKYEIIVAHGNGPQVGNILFTKNLPLPTKPPLCRSKPPSP